MVTEVKALHLKKHLSFKQVTDEGIVIEVKPLPQKQPVPIDVTDEGMVIEVKALHPLKQFSPIDVTDEGMVIDVKASHP